MSIGTIVTVSSSGSARSPAGLEVSLPDGRVDAGHDDHLVHLRDLALLCLLAVHADELLAEDREDERGARLGVD
jgi:hypothetical protein